jgi:hypothetical protein
MKHEYWVVFPQGIRTNHSNGGYGLSKVMTNIHSKRAAIDLMEKYDGAYFEKIIYKDGKRFATDWYSNKEYNDNTEVTQEQLWDLWKNKPEIVLND